MIKDMKRLYSANVYLFKINNRNIENRCEICSKLTIKTPDVVQVFFTVNFEDILHLF